jgi:predicted metal-dependent enzyme (double-stranded beta helix superfamily)
MITSEVRTDLLAVAGRYAARPLDWPRAPIFDPASRWYARLAVEEDHEAWLLTWLPGQATDLHDHGGSAGAFVLVSGALTERTVAAGDGPAVLVASALTAPDGRRFGPHHIHQLTNESQRPAVSVHVYGPALRTMTRYRISGAGLEVAAVDRAGAQW